MGNEQKVVFDDPDDHAKKGGLKVMCWSCLCGMTMMSTCCGWTLTILWIVILRNLESVEDLAPQTLENLLTWRATIQMLKSNSQRSELDLMVAPILEALPQQLQQRSQHQPPPL